MELARQIKKYRTEANLSQEELAERIFVSRQTISNWENDKSYPDVKSLVLLSEIFHVSLDKLIKGDLERMKKEIDAREYAEFKKDSNVFSILFVAVLILPVPALFLKWIGMALYASLWGVTVCYAVKIERYKKKYDVQTYKEIVAFMNGKSMDEIEKAREEGKRPYQKVLLAVGAVLLTLVIGLLMFAVIRMIPSF